MKGQIIFYRELSNGESEDLLSLLDSPKLEAFGLITSRRRLFQPLFDGQQPELAGGGINLMISQVG